MSPVEHLTPPARMDRGELDEDECVDDDWTDVHGTDWDHEPDPWEDEE